MQVLECGEQRLVGLGKVEADVAVFGLAEEAAARHACHLGVLRQVAGKILVACVAGFGDVAHHVVGALGLHELHVQVGQAVAEELALVGVLGRELVVVGVGHGESHHGGLHERGGRAHGEEVVHLLGDLHHFLGGDDVAQAPAGDGVGLGERPARDGAALHARQAGEIYVLVGGVDDVLVHLVGDDPHVVLLGQARDCLKLGACEDAAARVGGVAQDERFHALLRHGGLERGLVEGERGRHERHVDGLGVAQDRVGAVVLVEGREHDDLVAGVAHGVHGAHHGLGAAAGDDDVLVGVDVDAHEAALLGGERLAEVLRAPGEGVLVRALVGDLRQAVEELLGRVKVGETLGKVDGAVLERHAGHAADDRVGEAVGRRAECFHGRGVLSGVCGVYRVQLERICSHLASRPAMTRAISSSSSARKRVCRRR